MKRSRIIDLVEADKKIVDAFIDLKIVDVRMCIKYAYKYDCMEKECETMPEGGLTFILEDESKNRKIVMLGYTELGEWIEVEEEYKN